MALPVITSQAAFGSNPGAAAFTWTTVSNYIRSLGYERGRSNEFDAMQPGTGGAVLKDATSAFDPDNTGSAYYPNVVPMVPFRATALINGNTYNLFQHFVERWPRSMRVASTYTEREITTVDGFELLNAAGLASKIYALQTTNARVTSVLDDAGWSSTARTLGTGDSSVDALTFAPDDETSALTHLLDVANAEQGLLFIDGAGKVVFIGRHALLVSPYTASQATFTDATGGGVYQYTDLVPSYDKDHIINEWRGTRQGSVITLVAQDAASQTKYFRRTGSFSTLVTTDSELLNQAQWRLSKTKDPLNRIDSITVKPGNSTAAWETVLGLEIGERITVKEQPPGFSVQNVGDFFIQRIAVDLPSDLANASFTFGLWPSDISQYWLAATAGYAEAGVTTRPAY